MASICAGTCDGNNPYPSPSLHTPHRTRRISIALGTQKLNHLSHLLRIRIPPHRLTRGTGNKLGRKPRHHHLCQRPPRFYPIDKHPIFAIRIAQRADKRIHSPLRHRIRHLIRAAIARTRSNRHTAPPTACEHVGNCSLMKMINPVHIDSHHLIKLCHGLLKKRLLPSQNTGTTHQNIQPSKTLNRLCHARLNSGLIRHICLHKHRLLSQCLDLRNRFRPLFCQNIGNNNIPPLLRNPQRRCPTKPPRTPRNKRNPPFLFCCKTQIRHLTLLKNVAGDPVL